MPGKAMKNVSRGNWASKIAVNTRNSEETIETVCKYTYLTVTRKKIDS